jgi:hypothetical protein
MSESITEKPLSTGEWIVTELILIIPLVGLVMYFVWAFSEGNISRRNMCRARLIICAVCLGLAALVLIGLLVFTGVLAGLSSKYAH